MLHFYPEKIKSVCKQTFQDVLRSLNWMIQESIIVLNRIQFCNAVTWFNILIGTILSDFLKIDTFLSVTYLTPGEKFPKLWSPIISHLLDFSEI